MIFGSSRVLGLDIGNSSIKAAELNVSKGGAQLVSLGITPTPTGALGSGDIVNSGSLSIAVRSLFGDLRTKTKKVATGLWGTAVIVKKITIPKIEKKLIAEQIKWEAEQYIPYDINNISLSYHILRTPSTETMDLLLIAAQNDLVDQFSIMIRDSGKELAVLDVNGFALGNVFEFNYGKNVGENIAVLNFGSLITNFVVLSSGEIVFSRDIPIGGGTLTSEIQKELNVTPVEAESLKMSYSSRSAVPEEVNAIVKTVNESFAEEVKNSFDFFAASVAGVKINKVFLTGGGSKTPGVAEALTKTLEIPNQILNPFLRIRYNPKQYSEQFIQEMSPLSSVALGLALRKANDS